MPTTTGTTPSLDELLALLAAPTVALPSPNNDAIAMASDLEALAKQYPALAALIRRLQTGKPDPTAPVPTSQAAAEALQPAEGQPGMFGYGGAQPMLYQPSTAPGSENNPSFNPNLRVWQAPPGMSFVDALQAVRDAGASEADVMLFTNPATGQPEAWATNDATLQASRTNAVKGAKLDEKVRQQSLASIAGLQQLLANPDYVAQPKSDIQAQLDLYAKDWSAHPERPGQSDILTALGTPPPGASSAGGGASGMGAGPTPPPAAATSFGAGSLRTPPAHPATTVGQRTGGGTTKALVTSTPQSAAKGVSANQLVESSATYQAYIKANPGSSPEQYRQRQQAAKTRGDAALKSFEKASVAGKKFG